MKRNVILLIVVAVFLIIGIVSIRFHKSNLLSREILEESFELGRTFLLHNQRSAGNFNYEYDFITKENSDNDSPVRQAGALWGLSLVHQYQPGKETYDALIKGFAFFDSVSVPIDSTKRRIQYPNTISGKTGTQALVGLAHLEFLRTDIDSSDYLMYREKFDQYVRFLLSLRDTSGHFYSIYRYGEFKRMPSYSPYFDGETLLLLAKSAHYLGIDSLKPLIMQSAEAMYRKYVVEAQKEEPDSDQTKGFYQWGSMAFYEIYKMGWDDKYAQRTIDLAYWMIDVHKTLMRTKNTAYAHEGMITAWEVANLTGNERARQKIGFIIDKGLYKISRWQIGSSIQNRYLDKNAHHFDTLSMGGIMNCKDCPGLRIDVTQHQMHAVILALKYMYNE